MTFNVPEVVKLVANGVMQKVDANPENYTDMDFSDIGTQDALVQQELQDKLSELPDSVYDQLVENVIDHPEMQLCFEAVAVVVEDWKAAAIQADLERESMIRDFYREVL